MYVAEAVKATYKPLESITVDSNAWVYSDKKAIRYLVIEAERQREESSDVVRSEITVVCIQLNS